MMLYQKVALKSTKSWIRMMRVAPKRLYIYAAKATERKKKSGGYTVGPRYTFAFEGGSLHNTAKMVHTRQTRPVSITMNIFIIYLCTF